MRALTGSGPTGGSVSISPRLFWHVWKTYWRIRRVTGMGKTKIVRKFERDHPPKFNQITGVDYRPVVVAQVPSEPIERDLYRELLVSMAAPAMAGVA